MLSLPEVKTKMYIKLLLIFLLSLIIRWASYNYILSPLIFPADSGQYIAIAENIVAGNGFSVDGNEPVFHRAPFLPYFLSILLLLFKNNWLSIASAINILINSGVSIVVYFTALRIVDDKMIAIISALLFAINPVSIFWSGFILTEPFFLFFFTLSILYLLKSGDGQKMRDFITCGVLMGLAALTRPVILGVIPFIILWIAIFKDRYLKSIKIGLSVMIIIFILIILPWTIRNYLNSGEILPITSEGHSNLVQGLTEDPETLERIPLFTKEEDNSMRHLNEGEYRRIERKKMIQYIVNNPFVILGLMIRKVIIFWSVVPEIMSAELRAVFYIRLFMILWAIYSIIIYIFAIYGIFSVKEKANFMLIVFIIISFTLMHMFFLVVPEKRFRLPLEPYLTILAAVGLSFSWKGISKKFLIPNS